MPHNEPTKHSIKISTMINSCGVKVVYRYTQGSVSGSYHLPSSGGSIDELGLLEHVQDYRAIALRRRGISKPVELVTAIFAIALGKL